MFETKLARRGARPGNRRITARVTEHHEPDVSLTTTSALPPVQVDRALVDLLFGSSGDNAERAAQPSIPAGVHDYPTLSRVLAGEQLFTGVVAHIAMNDLPGCQELAGLVPEFLARLLGESDFGCHLADDEFLIICPGPAGAQAQRRLEQISDRLRRFQQDLVGGTGVLFSWAGVEAGKERLLDAVTRATEGMLQTKYPPNTVSIDSVTRQRA